MASFTEFLDILPDPNNPIGAAGQALAVGSSGVAGHDYGIAGPGFASVKLSSSRKTIVSKTNSGRAVARAIAGHTWKVDINYNPLTRDQFEPVYGFLLSRIGRLNPFYVILPNQSTTRTSSVPTLTTQTTTTAAPSGQTYMLVDAAAEITNFPRPGDMFNITDDDNTNHVKIYRITRVETRVNYDTVLPDGTTDYPANNTELRIHFTPPLSYTVPDGKDLVLTNPKIRVRLTGDAQEYSLGVNNLYSFSLKLEEALP